MDVLDAFGKFSQSLIDIANTGSYGMLFVILFLVGATGLIAQMTALVRAIRNRARQPGVESDEDVSAVTVVAGALSKLADILDKTSTNQTQTNAILERREQRDEQREAALAGLAAKLEHNTMVDKQFLEALSAHTIAINQLLALAGGIRTRDEAEAENRNAVDAITEHTARQIAPVAEKLNLVADHAIAQSVTLGMLDTGVKAVASKVDSLPPVLDALHVKVDGLPKIVIEAYAALTTERDNYKKAVEESVAQLMAKDAELDRLRADLASANETIRVQNATIAALPKPEPIAPLQSGEGSAKPPDLSLADKPKEVQA